MHGRQPIKAWRATRGTDNDAAVEQALPTTKAWDWRNRRQWELSGGERQRVAIATLLAQSPQLFLLDEPLNNLDMYYAKSLMQLLQRLTHEHKRTTVVVLHDINQAAAYADHIIAMQHGQVAFAGATDDVFTEANIKTLFNMDAAVIDYAGKKLVVHHV